MTLKELEIATTVNRTARWSVSPGPRPRRKKRRRKRPKAARRRKYRRKIFNPDIYTVMKGKKYSPEYSTQQGSHSDSTKNSKTLQARKSQENLVPSNQLYNKC